MLAATPQGPGSESFAGWLEIGDLAELEQRARDEYDLNAQTAISFRTLARRYDGIEAVDPVGAQVSNGKGAPGEILCGQASFSGRGDQVLDLG